MIRLGNEHQQPASNSQINHYTINPSQGTILVSVLLPSAWIVGKFFSIYFHCSLQGFKYSSWCAPWPSLLCLYSFILISNTRRYIWLLKTLSWQSQWYPKIWLESRLKTKGKMKGIDYTVWLYMYSYRTVVFGSKALSQQFFTMPWMERAMCIFTGVITQPEKHQKLNLPVSKLLRWCNLSKGSVKWLSVAASWRVMVTNEQTSTHYSLKKTKSELLVYWTWYLHR